MVTLSLNNKIFATVASVMGVFFIWYNFFRKGVVLGNVTSGTETCTAQDLQLPPIGLLVKQPYIIGGTLATVCPWMVKLGKGVLCGGCLISPLWILTASHCGINQGSEAILGAQNFLIHEPNQQRIEIQKIVRHPSFGFGPFTTLPNDIMLLKLSTPARIDNYVYPICLPGEWNLKGRNLVVYGWGNTQSTEQISVSSVLMQLTVQEATACKYSINQTTQLCTTASASPLQTTCFGDSGGPLVLNEFNKNFVVGLVSWGAQGTCENYTVFTRVSHYVPWIKQVTGL
jgi:secreted trypsin-like serine protease